MKKIILNIFLATLSIHSFCQTNNDTVALKDLIVPSSPAFSLLDITPKVIERPATVKAFAISIVNAANQTNGIPKNLAIEFAPFWSFKHPQMSIFKYNGLTRDLSNHSEVDKYKQNIFYGLRNTSISIGTASKDSSKSNSISSQYISYSIKTNILNVRKKRVLDSLHYAITDLNSQMLLLLDSAAIYCYKKDATVGDIYRKCINDTALTKNTLLEAKRKYYDTLLTIRPVFTLDLAIASSNVFINNSFSDNHKYRTGGWLNFCYSQPLLKSGDNTLAGLFKAKNYINIYGFFRMLNQDSTKDFKTFTNQTFYDYGGRLEFEFDRLAISFESVYRSVNNDKSLSSSRNVGILQYRINDNLFFTGTFGKNFGTQDNLVALFGLNWGLGKTSLVNKL